MRRLALALALLASPAQAQPPLISLVFGADEFTAGGDDIRSIRRIDEKGLGAALVIQLSPTFDGQMSRFTASHVGETGALLICGQTVLKPHLHAPIQVASFVISDTDPTVIDRLETLLAGVKCAPQLSS